MGEPAERMLRDLNDRLYVLLRDLKADEGKFDCECGGRDCGRSVELSCGFAFLARRSQRETPEPDPDASDVHRLAVSQTSGRVAEWT